MLESPKRLAGACWGLEVAVNPPLLEAWCKLHNGVLGKELKNKTD